MTRNPNNLPSKQALAFAQLLADIASDRASVFSRSSGHYVQGRQEPGHSGGSRNRKRHSPGDSRAISTSCHYRRRIREGARQQLQLDSRSYRRHKKFRHGKPSFGTLIGLMHEDEVIGLIDVRRWGTMDRRRRIYKIQQQAQWLCGHSQRLSLY